MKDSLQYILYILIQLIFGGLCGGLGALYYVIYLEFNNIVFMIGSLMICYIVCMGLHIIIHECGHLVFGLLTGYEFVSIRFGNFMFIKTDKGIQFKKFSLAGTGGQCLLAPPPYQQNNYPFVLYNLGGCLFNLVFSIISMLLFFILPYYGLKAILLIFCLCGLSTAATNGIPIKTKQITNDGANVVSLLKSQASKEAFWKQMKINELASKEMRLKDMPFELFQLESVKKKEDALIASIKVFEIQHTMDQMDFSKAKQQILELLEKKNVLIGIHEHLLINDLIYIYALENNQNQINQYMTKEHKKMRKMMKTNISFLRTDYTLDLLNHRDSTAYQQFLKEIKTYPLKIDIESETELIQKAKETIH